MTKPAQTAGLAALRRKLQSDKSLPLREQATQLVFGEGNPGSPIVFMGEAPGLSEDQQGRPFVGAAGKLLDKLIHGAGLSRDNVYITNVVKYRPPENRPPSPAEIAAFQPYLIQELNIIKPQLIITLGRFALNIFLPDQKITQVHGKLKRCTNADQDFYLYPLYHPAAALRSSQMRQGLEQDFGKLPRVLAKLKI